MGLLQSHHTEVQIIEYLKTPPELVDIERALALLRMEPRELIRTTEDEYRTLHLDDRELTRAQLIAAMHAHPILIQRPVVFANGRACMRACVRCPQYPPFARPWRTISRSPVRRTLPMTTSRNARD